MNHALFLVMMASILALTYWLTLEFVKWGMTL